MVGGKSMCAGHPLRKAFLARRQRRYSGLHAVAASFAVLLSQLHLWWNSTQPAPPQLLHGPRTVNSWCTCVHMRCRKKVALTLLLCPAVSILPPRYIYCFCFSLSVPVFFNHLYLHLCNQTLWKKKNPHGCHNSILICCDIYLMWKQIVKCLEFAVRQNSVVAASMANCTLNAPCPIVN